MDPMFQTLFSWQLIMFGLTIAGIMYVIRAFIDYFVTQSRLKFLDAAFLPAMHIILGGLLGFFFSSFPYPDQLIQCWDRVVFGIVAGLLSDPMYRLIQYVISPKTSLILQIINAIAVLFGKGQQSKENKDNANE